MASLFTYMRSVQRLIGDSKMSLVDPGDIIVYINEARRDIALRTQSVRVVPVISGSVTAINVATAGTGYTNPTVTITTPDFPSGAAPYPNGAQATAIATQIGGSIAGINMVFGGAGYYQPQVIINDPTGTGATATAQLTPIAQTIQGQEVYNYSDFDLSPFPGVETIFAVKSVSILYSNYRYSLACYSFSTYQAKVRNFPFQYEYVPTICAQFGQGASGSLYLYPIPSQAYQLELDCFCIPQDLNTDQDVEALPEPFNEAVQYYGAYKCFLELQNQNSARAMLELYENFIHKYSSYARPGRTSNPYGRW